MRSRTVVLFVAVASLAACAKKDPAQPSPPAPALRPRGTPVVAPHGTVRVGGRIREPRLRKHVRPDYPEKARRARVTGSVILEVLIDKEGHVADTVVLRSLPLFDQAAVDAVGQWEYEPTVVDGAPVPVLMTVTVNFQLQ